mgnify:CR=1 FL=1
MRKDRLYIGFLVFSILLYAVTEFLKPTPLSWAPDFTKNSSIPFGAEIVYDNLDVLFPSKSIEHNNRTLYSTDVDSTNSRPKNWIFINNQFGFDPFETGKLIEWAEQGHQIFISGLVAGKLADTLNLELEFFFSLLDSVAKAGNQTVNFKNTLLNSTDWKYTTKTNIHHITSFDTAKTEVLGYWNKDQVNFIKTNVGDGAFYINSTPHLFTNYYLRNPELATYAFTALSYLPIEETIWDSYYKAGRKVAGTPMAIILQTDGLKHAWYLAICTLLLFMIFKAKREQRIIPIIEPPQYWSIKFAETIGELYMEQGSNREVLDKKLAFFYEYIATHLHLNTSNKDSTFKTDLAFRSGIEKQSILALFDLIELTEASDKITLNELKLITSKIDEFYKNTQR